MNKAVITFIGVFMGDIIQKGQDGKTMSSWSELTALTGFHYSGVTGELKFTGKPGKYFSSDGYAWGTAEIAKSGTDITLKIRVLCGDVRVSNIIIEGYNPLKKRKSIVIPAGSEETFSINKG